MCIYPRYPKAREFINVLSKIANFKLDGTHGAFMLFHAWQGMKQEFKPDTMDGVEIQFSDQLDLENFQRTVNETIQNIYDKVPEGCGPQPVPPLCCNIAEFEIDRNDYCCWGYTDIIRALNGLLNMMFQNSSGSEKMPNK